LAQLARALRERDAVEAQGVALAKLLLTEPSSPLYRPQHSASVYEAAREALLALTADSRAPLARDDLRRHESRVQQD
jgi:hypothetical protein